MKAKSLHVGVDLIALIFSRKLKVTGLNIDQPQIWLLQAPSGEWNFSSLGAKSGEKSGAHAAEAPSSSSRAFGVSEVTHTYLPSRLIANPCWPVCVPKL